MLVNVKFRLLGVLILPLLLVLITGADHRDAPGLINDPASDINDVYAFVDPNDTSKVVLAMTVNPFTAPGINQTFSPDTLYQFKIDNTGDATEDLVIQVTFDQPDNIGPDDPAHPGFSLNTTTNPAQKFTVHGPAKPSKTGPVNTVLTSGTTFSGMIDNRSTDTPNTFTDASSGITAFAGARDDPFFFDLVAILGFLRDPVGKTFVPARGFSKVDFFAGVNVSIIAIEVPSALLKGSNGNTIKVWGTTNVFTSEKRALKTKKGESTTAVHSGSKTFAQFDRMGLPAINTVLVFPEHKDAFNLAIPTQDKDLFRTDAINHILPINGGNMVHAATIADILLPDVLTLDVTSTEGISGGYVNGNFVGTLNGRRPQDDVISVEVDVLTIGAITNVNPTANDVPFLTVFPFFAKPHAPAEGVPKRN